MINKLILLTVVTFGALGFSTQANAQGFFARLFERAAIRRQMRQEMRSESPFFMGVSRFGVIPTEDEDVDVDCYGNLRERLQVRRSSLRDRFSNLRNRFRTRLVSMREAFRSRPRLRVSRVKVVERSFGGFRTKKESVVEY